MPSSPFVGQDITDTNSKITTSFTGQNINDTNWTISSPFVGQSINQVARAVFAIVGSIMIVCGVIGNGLLIAVICRRFQRKQRVHNLFLVNMSVADILILGYWVTFLVLDLILGYHPVVNQAHCVANGVIISSLAVAFQLAADRQLFLPVTPMMVQTLMSHGISPLQAFQLAADRQLFLPATPMMVSVTSLFSISLNRYLLVCHSHLYTRTFTLPRTLLFCLFIWVLGLTLALPPALGIGAGSYHYSLHTHICSLNRENHMTYPKIMVILFSTISIFCTGSCNFAIFRLWKRDSLSNKYRLSAIVQEGKRRGNILACCGDLLQRIRSRNASSTGQGKGKGTDHLQCQNGDGNPEIRVEECTGVCHNIDNDTGVSHVNDNTKDNPDIRVKECGSICLNMDILACIDSHIESCTLDTDWPEEDKHGNTDEIKYFPGNKDPDCEEECTESTSCNVDADVYLKKKTDEEQDCSSDQENHNRCESEEMSKERNISTSENGPKTVKEISVVVTEIHPPSRLGQADTELPTPSRLGQVDTELPTPSRLGQVDTELLTPSRLGQVDTELLTPSRLGQVDTELPTPSRLRQTDAELLTPSAEHSLSPPKRQNTHLNASKQTLQRQQKEQHARKVAFVRSLFVVFLISCFSCLPYGITFVVSSYVTVSSEVVILGILLRFTSSSVSWIVYGVMIPSFRKSYMELVHQLLGPCYCVRREERDSGADSSQHTVTANSMLRYNAESDLEPSCASRPPSGIRLGVQSFD